MGRSSKRGARLVVAAATVALALAACSARFVPEPADGGVTDASMPAPSSSDAASPPDVATVEAGPPDAPLVCAAASFPASLAVAEASATTILDIAGTKKLYVVGDSGTGGRGLLVDLASGDTTALDFPLGSGASDDLEGMSFHAGRLYALTSAGAVREATLLGDALVSGAPPYRIAPAPFSCTDLGSGNCGKDWEGLCLRPQNVPDGQCAGYAASKVEGALYCVLVDADGHLSLRTTAPIPLGLRANVLSDCAFGAIGSAFEDVLLVTTNASNGNLSYRVDPASFVLTALPIQGPPAAEAIALDGAGRVYVFGDNGTATSSLRAYACGPWN